MKDIFLCSGIEPLIAEEGEKTINDCFKEEFEKADWVEISVGYFGYKTLLALDVLVNKGHIKHICLTLGMYFNDGELTAGSYKLVMKINKKWVEKGIGEIRLVHHDTYHGKLYCFGKDNEFFSVMVGSANFSFLAQRDPKFPKRHESGQLTINPDMLQRYKRHIEKTKSPEFSANIADLEIYKQEIYKEDPKTLKKVISKIRYKK